MFAYCNNNPVFFCDDGGFKPKSYDETCDDDEDEFIVFPGGIDDGTPQIDKGTNISAYTKDSPSSVNLATIEPVYNSFTSYYFRYNLKLFTGQDGFGMQAHHVFPQYYEELFADAGITIHDPQYGSWVYPFDHQSWSYDYYMEWYSFFDGARNPSITQIEDFARELAGKYGFEIYF